MSVPFDKTAVWGWFLLWFLQINTAFSYCLATILPTSYFMICCLYINALCDHFDLIIRLIGENVKETRTETNSLKKQIFYRKINNDLISAVKHHSKILE